MKIEQRAFSVLRDHARGPIAALLLVLALAPRFVIPAGFMPVQEQSGSFSVSICNGSATGATVVLSIRGGRPAPAGDHSNVACPYAVLALAVLDTPPIEPSQAPELLVPPAVPPENSTAPLHAIWNHWQARGPPARA